MGNASTGDTACVDIRILDDDALEGFHSFTVTLDSTTPSDGVTISTPSAAATVNIQDNEGTVP